MAIRRYDSSQAVHLLDASNRAIPRARCFIFRIRDKLIVENYRLYLERPDAW
jgi:hypothetical protein